MGPVFGVDEIRSEFCNACAVDLSDSDARIPICLKQTSVAVFAFLTRPQRC